jgi:hypothetical protein
VSRDPCHVHWPHLPLASRLDALQFVPFHNRKSRCHREIVLRIVRLKTFFASSTVAFRQRIQERYMLFRTVAWNSETSARYRLGPYAAWDAG